MRNRRCGKVITLCGGAVYVLLFMLSSSHLFSQASSPGSGGFQAQTGTLKGAIFNVDKGRMVPETLVAVLTAENMPVRTVILKSDAAGSFQVKNLPVGVYDAKLRLSGSQRGFSAKLMVRPDSEPAYYMVRVSRSLHSFRGDSAQMHLWPAVTMAVLSPCRELGTVIKGSAIRFLDSDGKPMGKTRFALDRYFKNMHIGAGTFGVVVSDAYGVVSLERLLGPSGEFYGTVAYRDGDVLKSALVTIEFSKERKMRTVRMFHQVCAKNTVVDADLLD